MPTSFPATSWFLRPDLDDFLPEHPSRIGLVSLVDIAIVVNNHVMEQVEDVHLLLGHVITTCLRQAGPQQDMVMEAVRVHEVAPILNIASVAILCSGKLIYAVVKVLKSSN